jgi:hypothetical protein
MGMETFAVLFMIHALNRKVPWPIVLELEEWVLNNLTRNKSFKLLKRLITCYSLTWLHTASCCSNILRGFRSLFKC